MSAWCRNWGTPREIKEGGGGGGEGAMCGEGGTGNRQELEGKRQEGWSDRHIMFEMSDISIISRSITLRAHTVIDNVCK